MIVPGRAHYSGILLATVIGLASHFGSAWTPSSLNGIMLALLLGILVRNLLSIPARFQPGVAFTGGRLLELSLIFLAFSIDYGNIAAVGFGAFSLIAVMVFAMVLITYYLAWYVKCPGSTGWLVGFGTAICGSSAIAALAPSVSKDNTDVGVAMAVINLFGSIGMVAMPIVLMEMDLNTAQMGLLLGGTLHSVGNVVGAGYAMESAVGEAAITIKLARVALLSPALILFNFLVNRAHAKSFKEHLRLPWYLWGFIGITALTSLVAFPSIFLDAMGSIGTVSLTIAMAAIGLQVSFRGLFRSGRRGIGFGLLVFAIQIALVGAMLLVV